MMYKYENILYCQIIFKISLKILNLLKTFLLALILKYVLIIYLVCNMKNYTSIYTENYSNQFIFMP